MSSLNKITFEIQGQSIGTGCSPYIIAELSGNHNGDITRAFAIMEAAKAAGADAIKLQTYTADTITIDHDGPGFVIEGGLWNGRRLYELYQEAHTPWEWHEALFAKGRELGITVFSSPFDDTAVDFLEKLDVPAYKIASFEAADTPLVRKVAATGKPLIISTGMVTPDEIEETLEVARSAGAKDIALLHCVSAYPANPKDTNLITISQLEERFGVLAGLSDHTLGTAVSVSAVVLGAQIIEKHVTLSRADGGPDAEFSLEPDELKALVEDCHIAWRSIGEARIGRQEAAEDSLVFKRSLYVVDDMKAGDVFTALNVRSIRPGYGLAPKHLDEIYGHVAKKEIKRGTPMSWALVE